MVAVEVVPEVQAVRGGGRRSAHMTASLQRRSGGTEGEPESTYTSCAHRFGLISCRKGSLACAAASTWGGGG